MSIKYINQKGSGKRDVMTLDNDNSPDPDDVYMGVAFEITMSNPYEWSYEFKFTIRGNTEENEDFEIGNGRGWILSIPDNYDDFVSFCDRFSEDCYNTSKEIGKDFFEDRLKYEGQIVYIEKMHVKQEYQGNGYGKLAMESIINYFYDRMILIYPHPLPRTCPEHLVSEGVEKLRKYWETCGFEQINNGSVFFYADY